MTKLYEVRDGDSFIGTYRARNAAHAVQRARDDQAQTAATFRKSQPAIRLVAPRAFEIQGRDPFA
jgi:hypothetical protein